MEKVAMAARATYCVLLVEDNPADVYVIQRVVEDCGQDIHLWVVPDGPEALTFLRKDPPLTHVPTPDLIIVDLNLPKMIGAELVSEIRQLPNYRTTPVVILSSAARELEEARCLQLGASAYFQKALNYYVFSGDIKTIVQQWLRPASGQ
jgi:two-component system response regulator